MPISYIRVIKNIYDSVRTRVKTLGDSDNFPIEISLHQESAQSPFIFTMVIDELIRGIQDEVSWCMMFADGVVLIDVNKEGVSERLEQWRDT